MPVAALALAGCGASSDTSPGASVSSSVGGHGGAGGVSPVGGAGGVTVGVGGSVGCGPPCSNDLKQVLDCDGQVVTTCGTDMACLDGACSEDPCAAAAAAKSGQGCDFWALRPGRDSSFPHTRCFAVLVANTWDAPAHLTVRRLDAAFADTDFIRVPQGEGQNISYDTYDPVAGLGPGEVAVLFLSHRSDMDPNMQCPIPAALDGEDGVYGTGRGQAFAIEADRPVTAHSIYPYGANGVIASASASLLFPVSAWGTNYIAITPYEGYSTNTEYPAGLAILAHEDRTEITLLPKVPIQGGVGVAPSPADVPVTYTLDAGEYVQLSQFLELTGSAVESNEPVGVWGETSCFRVPTHVGACDADHQQLPPVRALGNRYAGVRYRNRSIATTEEVTPWRLVGAVDGTKLSWKPAPPAAGLSTLDQGELIEFFAPGPFVVESQDDEHPFYLAQYMTGSGFIFPDPGTGGEGDPEWVHVIATAQYLERYLFFTDPTYSETSLVVVRERSNTTQQFADVMLDCAGALSGWQPLGDDLEYTRVDLVAGGLPVGGCNNGRHEMTSTAPFGVTIWGWSGGLYAESSPGGWVSYGYPAGASLRALNDVIIPPVPE